MSFCGSSATGGSSWLAGLLGSRSALLAKEVDLVSDEVAVLISLGHPLLEHLGNVDVRKKGDQRQHQSADGEHELVLRLKPWLHELIRETPYHDTRIRTGNSRSQPNAPLCFHPTVARTTSGESRYQARCYSPATPTCVPYSLSLL